MRDAGLANDENVAAVKNADLSSNDSTSVDAYKDERFQNLRQWNTFNLSILAVVYSVGVWPNF